MRLTPPIRLSTAVLLMFVAGGFIWLNTLESTSVEHEPIQVGVKPSSERWEVTKTLSTELQNDSPLRPGFTLLKFPAVYETRTRVKVTYRGQGFPLGISRQQYTVTGSPFQSILFLPLIGNVLVGVLVLWNVAVVMAYCLPIEEKKK